MFVKNEKMQNFISGYSRMENETVRELKTKIVAKEKPTIISFERETLYLQTFTNLQEESYEIFYSEEEVFLLRYFKNYWKTFADSIEVPYKICGISKIERVFHSRVKFNNVVYVDVETTLVVLNKYGIFQIGTYKNTVDANQVLKDIYQNKKLSIVPSSESKIYKELDKRISYYFEDKKDEYFIDDTEIEFTYLAKDEKVGEENYSDVYLNDKIIFSICLLNSKIIDAKINLKNLNKQETISFVTNISEFDFSNENIDCIVKVFSNGFALKGNLVESSFNSLRKIKLENLSKEIIYSKILEMEYKNFFDGYIDHELINIYWKNNAKDMFYSEYQDENSFIGKTYLIDHNFKSSSIGGKYNIYVYTTRYINIDNKTIRNIILFVEDLVDLKKDISVVCIYEELKQVKISLRNQSFNKSIPLPFWYFGIGNNINAGNINVSNKMFVTTEFAEGIFKFIYEKIKDLKVEIELESAKNDLDSQFLYLLYKNDNKIKFKTQSEDYVGYNDIFEVIITINDQLVLKEKLVLVSKEDVAKVDGKTIFTIRYQESHISKTFKELGIEPDNLELY